MAKVIWFTGISGAGKTTLGTLLKQELEKKHGKVEFLDGDEIRKFFENDLGYTRKERLMNIRRITFAAMVAARNGTNVVVANIAPYYEARDFIRKHIKHYIQIYLKTSIEKVIERDVKGQYRKYKNGRMKDLIGVDDAYDVPRNPSLTVDTENESVGNSFEKIRDFLVKQKII